MVRRATSADSGALFELQQRLDVQSSFMLLEPGERGDSADAVRDRLRAQGELGSFDLVADGAPDHPGLVGWIAVEVLPYRRAEHVGHVVMGVDAAASGRGVGRRLLEEAAREARRRGLRRLELTVMADNHRARSLYRAVGFEAEGLRRAAVHRDGVDVDEHWMSLLLTSA